MNYQIVVFYLILLAYALIKDLFDQFFDKYSPENYTSLISKPIQSHHEEKYSHSLLDLSYFLSNISATIFGSLTILTAIKIPVISFISLKLNIIYYKSNQFVGFFQISRSIVHRCDYVFNRLCYQKIIWYPRFRIL